MLYKTAYIKVSAKFQDIFKLLKLSIYKVLITTQKTMTINMSHIQKYAEYDSKVYDQHFATRCI